MMISLVFSINFHFLRVEKAEWPYVILNSLFDFNLAKLRHPKLKSLVRETAFHYLSVLRNCVLLNAAGTQST